MASIIWRHTAPTAPNRQRNCCRKSSTLPYRPEINLYASYHALHDESTIQSQRPLQIRPEQPTPSLQNCHAHSLKTAKHFSELATYLAFFSMTYLATSLKLAKFSVTERTAGGHEFICLINVKVNLVIGGNTQDKDTCLLWRHLWRVCIGSDQCDSVMRCLE